MLYLDLNYLLGLNVDYNKILLFISNFNEVCWKNVGFHVFESLITLFGSPFYVILLKSC